MWLEGVQGGLLGTALMETEEAQTQEKEQKSTGLKLWAHVAGARQQMGVEKK